MNIVGGDPGLNGGVAVIRDDGTLISADHLPTMGAGTKRRINAIALQAWLTAYAFDDLGAHGRVAAILEDVHAMPKQGVSSSFRFGQAFGTFIGVVAGLKIPTNFVTPAKWKREMRLGKDKEDSRRLAIEQWPESHEFFKRKMDADRAEAALLALWWLKTEKNGG